MHQISKSQPKFFALALLSVALVVLAANQQQVAGQDTDASSYLDQMRKLLSSSGRHGSDALTRNVRSQAILPSADDPRAAAMIRDSIQQATDLINNYRRNGLANMPALPNLPGLNVVTKIPDKLLRAELSMLQDEIRMAQEMMRNPISATMNAPKDLAGMLARMAEQLEQ